MLDTQIHNQAAPDEVQKRRDLAVALTLLVVPLMLDALLLLYWAGVIS